MAAREDSIKLLSEFGLTSYEAKVYMSATKLGMATVSSIAKVAGIRREEAYRAIPKLEKIGLLERIMGRPVRVKAISLDEGLTTLFEIKEEETSTELRQLLSKKEKILERFNYAVDECKVDAEQSQFVLISEKEALSRKVTSSIENAHKSIDFADSFENALRFILSYGDSLRDARKKKVEVRILTEYPEDAGLIPRYLKKFVPKNSFSVRYSEQFPSRYMLFDAKQALIATSLGQTFTDSNCLWTNDPNLLSIIHRDFEEQHREAMDWKNHSMTLPMKLGRILKRLKPRDHVILIYESTESKQNALFSYIQSGLLQDEGVVYVCCEQTPDTIREELNKFGIDASKYEHNGALRIVPYTEVYIRDGKFNQDLVMDFWRESYDMVMERGFRGLRVAGETACFAWHNMIEELLDYEEALHRILDIPMIALCAYNSNVLSEIDRPIDVYSELVKDHGQVIFASEEKIGNIEIRKA